MGKTKHRKALSPVVAAIILIAVTVAVSIAVAAWMGALTFTFMKTEELKITRHTWASDSTYVDIAVKNTGTAKMNITAIQANGADPDTGWAVQVGSLPLEPGDSATLRITHGYSSGTKYEFSFVSATGNVFKYMATAPS
jgi:flagellin-like protein